MVCNELSSIVSECVGEIISSDFSDNNVTKQE